MPNTNEDLLLFEPSYDGHYLHYVARIARAATALGHTVTLTTSAEANLAVERVLSDIDMTVRMEKPNQKGTLIQVQMKNYAWLKEEINLLKPQHVMLPFGNHVSKILGLKNLRVQPNSVSLLLMRDHFHLAAMGAEAPESKKRLLDEVLFRLLLRNKAIKNVFTIDPLLVEYSKQRGFKNVEKLSYIPDPIANMDLIDQLTAKTKLNIPANQKIILVFGVLDERKGLGQLIEAVAELDHSPAHILAVGKQNDSAKEALASESAHKLRSRGSLTELAGFADKEREGLVFSAADIVWVGYKGHFGSSGVLYQAAQASVPIVATSQGLIGYEARQHDVGSILNSYQPTDIQKSIETILTANSEQKKKWKENMATFAAEHSESTFATNILKRIF